MHFAKRRAMAKPLTASLIALAVSACATTPPIAAIPNACSELIADSLRADVPPSPLPDEEATAGSLWEALRGQTRQLTRANDYKAAVIETVERCEKRDAATVKALTRKPWWRLW